MKIRLLCQIERFIPDSSTLGILNSRTHNLFARNWLTSSIDAENWDEVEEIVQKLCVQDNRLSFGWEKNTEKWVPCPGVYPFGPYHHVVRVMQIIIEEEA